MNEKLQSLDRGFGGIGLEHIFAFVGRFEMFRGVPCMKVSW